MTDIISAISTPHGSGGVAIIRMSGEGVLELASKMFTPKSKTDVESFIPNMLYTGTIQGDGFCDFGMCVYFKAPKSYTGEDTVEFHCHGGVQIARGILKRTLQLGARAAERGEFTRRAFINGKMTLSSAEGVIDMINAESLAALRAGNMLYSEKFSQKIVELQNELKEILAEIATDLDYPEEDSEGLNRAKINKSVLSLSEKIQALIKSYDCGRVVKDGVRVAICGKPNAGKSSLLNALLGFERAIVDDEEGTTRDFVEGSLELDGIRYNLIDTAGIRDGASRAEMRGVERAKDILKNADIVLSVSDGRGEADISGANGKIVRVFNKCDCLSPNGEYDVVVSAKTGEGLDKLREILKSFVGDAASDKLFVIERRHFDALTRAGEYLKEVKADLSEDLLSIDLTECWAALGEITGESANEEIISEVFSKFCVGK